MEPILSVYRNRKLAAAVIAASLALLLSGCAGGSSPPGSGASAAKLDGPKDTVALYRNNCISCHGTDMQGLMGGSSDLRKVGARMDKEQIRKQIERGGSLMPAFKARLTAKQIDALADWLAGHKTIPTK